VLIFIRCQVSVASIGFDVTEFFPPNKTKPEKEKPMKLDKVLTPVTNGQFAIQRESTIRPWEYLYVYNGQVCWYGMSEVPFPVIWDATLFNATDWKSVIPSDADKLKPNNLHWCPVRSRDEPKVKSRVPAGTQYRRDWYDIVERTCVYCGSAHPDEFMTAVNSGAKLESTDKDYKVYLVQQRPWSMRKFYFAHLSMEQRAEFIQLLNGNAVSFSPNNRFTVLPFFAKYREPGSSRPLDLTLL
jgi:hypothetical protein